MNMLLVAFPAYTRPVVDCPDLVHGTACCTSDLRGPSPFRTCRGPCPRTGGRMSGRRGPSICTSDRTLRP